MHLYIMAEPFSTTDVYYVNAKNCSEDTTNNECKYKENVDKLNELSASHGLTTSQSGDLNKEHSLLLFNNISLGIGIAGMMWMMYS
jgi:hypothetical protein